MARVLQDRINRVLERLEATHPDAQLLVTDPWSIFYLTGFYAEMYERFSGVLLKAGSAPVIFDNALYPIDAYEDAEVVVFSDTDDLSDVLMRHIDPALPLGIDAQMRSGFLIPLQERRAAPMYFLGSDAVAATRAIKDEREQELMRASSRINDAVMTQLPSLVHPGASEREIAAQLLDLYHAQGCEGFSFAPIVSFGSNAADPHHEPDGTVLGDGQVVLFDIGGQYRGYCSDMTRTFFWGAPDAESARIYDVVRAANEAAERMIRPGVRFCDIDRTAREIIEEAGYGPYFTHRLGHSIGLQDHEPGDVSLANEAVVEPGMTFSIEPGIYLPGRTGVRIEDLVFVGEEGAEVLNSFTHEPTRIDR